MGPSIMRYLGQFPSEQEIVEVVLRELVELDGEGAVSYDLFEKMMFRSLLEREYDPDDGENLLAAFQALDPERRGYIEATRLREYLSSGPVGLRDKEWDSFLEYSKDSGGHNGEVVVYYEDYVAKLTSFVDQHIEGLYRDVKK